MSNDSNVSIDGEIDAGFTSYWDSDKHGQTVGGTTEDDKGSVETDIWPKGVDPEDLTEKQKRAISTAVKNPTLTTKEVAERCEISQSTVHHSLTKYAKEWYNNNFKDVGKSKGGNSPSKQAAAGENQEKILALINENSGISTGELVDELGISPSTVGDHIKKIDSSNYEVKTAVDGYHHKEKVYYPADSDGEGESADVWVEKEDDKRVDQHETETLADSDERPEKPERVTEDAYEAGQTDVQEILGVLKATAVHQETKQALDVLEGYL